MAWRCLGIGTTESVDDQRLPCAGQCCGRLTLARPRVAVHEDGARAAECKSEHAPAPTLVAIGNLVGRNVVDHAGANVGNIIGIMAECERGLIAFAVVGVGGVGVGGIGE